MQLSDTIFRAYRIIGRTIIKYSGNKRPASLPFITGDGFRASADHIYDNSHPSIQPEHVKEYDVVFVGDSNFEKFFSEIHPHITQRYILITHNGDAAIGDKEIGFIDEKIIRWYGINVITNHPKVTPIPLGIENKHIYVFGIPWILKSIAKKNTPKVDKMFYGFTISTNTSERQPAFEAAQRNPLAETTHKWLNPYKYLRLLAKYKFVISPPGSCVEGHRTWEALYIGVIPVVKSSITTRYFKKLGIPLVLIENWNEINTTDEIPTNFNVPAIYMDYWIKKIRETKD